MARKKMTKAEEKALMARINKKMPQVRRSLAFSLNRMQKQWDLKKKGGSPYNRHEFDWFPAKDPSLDPSYRSITRTRENPNRFAPRSTRGFMRRVFFVNDNGFNVDIHSDME